MNEGRQLGYKDCCGYFSLNCQILPKLTILFCLFLGFDMCFPVDTFFYLTACIWCWQLLVVMEKYDCRYSLGHGTDIMQYFASWVLEQTRRKLCQTMRACGVRHQQPWARQVEV